MAEGRKFNIGRQSEQLLNEDMFKAYNRIKYVGYGPKTPVQQYQARIPDYALWIDSNTGEDVLKRYNQAKGIWSPMFEGYYHPACLTEMPKYPVEGQLMIDQNGVLRFYDDNQWKVAAAKSATNLSNVGAGISNFLLMQDMKPVTGTSNNYLVPYLAYGKLFDNKKFVPLTDYDGANDINLIYPKDASKSPNEKISWVHVNPTYLHNVNKRFIKVLDSIRNNNYFIDTTTTNTEFYGFKSGEPFGTLLRYIQTSVFDNPIEDINKETTDTVSDYRKVSGGIQLLNNGRTYDYIYAITYKFDSTEKSPGYVLTNNNDTNKTITIGDNNQVYVGTIGGGTPLVFLAGTYLEQSDYTYDKSTGMLEFSGASITNQMDLTVAAFADCVRNYDTAYNSLPHTQKPLFDVTATSANIDINGTLTIQHNYLKQVANFKHPVAFVQGVAGCLYNDAYNMNDEIEINSSTGQLKVFNFGSIPTTDTVKIMVADIGDALLSTGILDSNSAIVSDDITTNRDYLLFVNGICVSPSDLDISTGKLRFTEGSAAGSRYVLMSLDKGDSGIDLLFDSPVSYFTVQIDDANANVVYNDCNMVVAYAYDNTTNGVLIDQNCITKKISGEDAYSTGEIIKVLDTDDSSPYAYTYKIFNLNGDYTWSLLEQSEIDMIETQMITQFNGRGSLSIMSNPKLKGKKLTYYAYTYADEVDEHVTFGSGIAKIAVENHQADANIPDIQNFYVSRMQYYSPPGKGILASYINGIQVKSVDNDKIDCRFDITTPTHNNFIKKWGTQHDLYPLLKEINNETTLVDLMNLKATTYSNELKEYSVDINLLEMLKKLAAVIKEQETNNELFYYVEKLEAGELYSVDRSWCTFANRYPSFDNTYTSLNYIGPGSVNVYLNGVMLDKSSYSLFDNNNVILNDLAVSGGSDEWDLDKPDTHRMIKYYKEEYDKETGKTKGIVHKLLTKTPDEVMIEYRPDTSIRKVSYEIKETTYDSNGILYYEDYEFPNSLITSKDTIKIYIDGILYTGGYTIEDKNIILLNSPLQLDPIKKYFNTHPDTYSEWKKENGEYTYRKSRIIFEWR